MKMHKDGGAEAPPDPCTSPVLRPSYERRALPADRLVRIPDHARELRSLRWSLVPSYGLVQASAGSLRLWSLVRNTGPRSASFARFAVVAGAFVRSGTRVGWSPRCVWSLVRSAGPRSASFARFAVVAGAFVRSGTRVGWLLRLPPQAALSSAARSVSVGRLSNHYRPSPEPSAETVAPTVAEPVALPMPPTNCPKLRRMRELLAEEAAAKVQNDRAQRQAAAIQKWRAAPAEAGHAAFFQLGVDLRSAGMSLAEIELTLCQEAGYARHPAERRREIRNVMRTLGDRPADWQPDHRRHG